MTSTTPPPPKHGGSGPLIVAALVMLLLMGGLIYWKTSQNNSPPPPAPSVATTATTPVFDEPPPPPPPPEEPKDAGAEAKPSKRVASTAPGGCAGECKGEVPANMRAMLAAKGGQARGCYERALRQNNMLQGRLRVSLRIAPNGSVCSANVTSNELGDPGVASCVLQMFRSSTFPSPQGGCVDAEVPLRFEPKK
jgi:hypothetical protein